MIDRHTAVSSLQFTLTALSLLLIVWSVLVPVFATSTPVEVTVSADRLAAAHVDILELTEDLVPPVNFVRVAWSPLVSLLNLTAVIEWAWYSTPSTRPPNSANSI